MSLTQEQIERLKNELPDLQPPVANYVPAVLAGEFIYVSGQLPMQAGKLACETGIVPNAVSIELASKAAALCARNGLAAVGWAINGDWARFVRVVRVGVFVASAADFHDQAKVANGASDWLGDMLGEAGKHCRAAAGAASLPLGSPVEVEMIAQITLS